MKEFTVAPEVIEKIESMAKELHALCLDNGVPYVFSALLGSTEKTEKSIAFRKVVSSMIDGRIDRAPDFLVAMAEIAKAPEVQSGIANAIVTLSEMQVNDNCQCPECTARRAENAEGEAAPQIH